MRSLVTYCLLVIVVGQGCNAQDPSTNQATKNRSQPHLPGMPELFAWFESLEQLPSEDFQLIRTVVPPEQRMGMGDELRLAILLNRGDSTLHCKTLDLWERRIALSQGDQPQLAYPYESTSEITLDEATKLFIRFLQRPPHQVADKRGGISSIVLEGFVLAYVADRLGDQDTSRKIIQLLVQRNMAHELTRERLSDAIAFRFLVQFVYEFSNLDLSWSELLQKLRTFDSVLHEHAYARRVDRLLAALEFLTGEEDAHFARWKAIKLGQSQLSQAEQIQELVFQLRNQSGKPMSSFSFGNPLDDSRRELSPAAKLTAMGYAAVPQLVAALDDQTFTRSPVQYSPDPLGNVFTVGEVAVHVLSDIAKIDFSQHLQPAAMFEEPPGLDAAKREILEWWNDAKELGELGMLKKRVKIADGFDVYELAETLTQKYPSETLAILRPELARLDGDSGAWVLELLAAEPSPEMVPLLREQMNRQELSMRIVAARTLLSLGHEDVITKQIDAYKEIAASRNLYQQYTSSSFGDSNGINNLVSFLSECNRVEAIEAMANGFSDVQPELAETILHRVIAAFGKRESEWPRTVPPSSQEVRNAVIKVYLAALNDKRRRPPTTVEIGPDGEERPRLEQRICDNAAQYLGNLLTPKVTIDNRLSDSEGDELRRQLEKRVRAELLRTQ